MPSSWVNTECSIHRVQHTLSTAYTEYSIHRVQHTPKIVCGPFILTISSWPLNVALASGVPPYRSTANSQSSIWASKVKSPCQIPTVARYLTDELSRGAPSIDHLQALVQSCSITGSKITPYLAQSRLPSTRPTSLNHGLQVYLQTCSIKASQGISSLVRSRPRSVSPDSLDYSLQVCTIMAFKCIPILAKSRPSSASPNSLDRGLQVYLQTRSITACKFAQSWPPSASPNSLDYGLKVSMILTSKSICPNSLDHGLQVYLQIHSITSSKCISKVARSRPQSISLGSLDRHFQAHLETLSSTTCSQSRYTVCRWWAI